MLHKVTFMLKNQFSLMNFIVLRSILYMNDYIVKILIKNMTSKVIEGHLRSILYFNFKSNFTKSF